MRITLIVKHTSEGKLYSEQHQNRITILHQFNQLPTLINRLYNRP